MSVRSEKSLTTSRKVASISSYRPSSRSMGGDGGVSGSGCQRFEPAREGVKFGKACRSVFLSCAPQETARSRHDDSHDRATNTSGSSSAIALSFLYNPKQRPAACPLSCTPSVATSATARRPDAKPTIRPGQVFGPAGRRRATASRRQIILHRRTRGTCQRLQRWEALIRWICHRPCGSAPWHRRSGSALLTHRRTSWPSRQRAAGAPLAWMLLQGLGSCSKPTYPWLDMARTRGLPTARSCGGWRCAVAGASGSQSTSLACTFKVTSGSLCTARAAWVHGAPTRPPVCTLSAAR